MNSLIAKYASTVVAVMAIIFVSVACPGFNHRPEVPQELLKN